MEKELSQLSLMPVLTPYIHLVSKNYGLMYPSLLFSHLCPRCNLYHLHFLAGVLAVIFFTRFTISNPPLQRHLVILNTLIASLVAQTLKRLPGMQESQVRSLGREDPLEKEMATHSNTLAWSIPWREEPGRLQSMGLQRVGHDRATSLHFKHAN